MGGRIYISTFFKRAHPLAKNNEVQPGCKSVSRTIETELVRLKGHPLPQPPYKNI